MGEIRLAIFDLGEVCLRLTPEHSFATWESESGIERGALPREFEADEVFKQFERGKISARDYWPHFCRNFPKPISYEGWIKGWNAILGDEIPETLQTILALKEQGIRVVALSNTNETHVAAFEPVYDELMAAFDFRYYSNVIGQRKPDEASFAYVLESESFQAVEAVFFDDKLENVEAARSIGIQAHHFTSDTIALNWLKSR